MQMVSVRGVGVGDGTVVSVGTGVGVDVGGGALVGGSVDVSVGRETVWLPQAVNRLASRILSITTEIRGRRCTIEASDLSILRVHLFRSRVNTFRGS
jgi:hypothetical protein